MSRDDIWLAHHGIKGQKWGIRRFQNKDGSYTPAGKKRYGKNSGLKEYNDLNNDDSNHGPTSQDPDDYIFKKGSKVERLTSQPDEKFKDRTYVTQNETRKYYEGTPPSQRSGLFNDKYVLNKDCVIAGKKTVEKILNEIDPYLEIQTKEKLGKWANDYSYDHLLESDYVNDLMLKDTQLRKDFTDKLKNKGYDGIVDPVDSNILLGFAPTAVIFVNDVLDRYGQVKLEEIYE